MDRAAILHDILQRNALRREAHLPPLDVRVEYQRAVEQAHWRAVCDEHYATVRDEIVRRLRNERGFGWGHSVGARWMIEAVTAKELDKRFGNDGATHRMRLGYTGLDAALPQNLSRK
jgi:hypothetical protein